MVEQRLMDQAQPVGLICDSYHLCLKLGLFRKRMQLVIEIYVNGQIKGEWCTNDCEERKRFLRPVVTSAWSAKARKAMKGISKVRLKRSGLDPNEKITLYYPWWTGAQFKALKSHLIRHNTSIELAPSYRYLPETLESI